jgi:hypothetical protein
MKASFVLFLVFVCATINAQQQPVKPELSKMEWLVGSWKGMSNNVPFYEGWRKLNDSTMINFGIEVKGKDTIVKAADQLAIRGQDFFLGKLPNFWLGARLTDNEIVLRNDSLKYSNRIIWLHTKEDHWFTILEHPVRTVYYDLTRVAAFDPHVDKAFEKYRSSLK